MNETIQAPEHHQRRGHINVPWTVTDALLGVAVVVGGGFLAIGVLRWFHGGGLEVSTPTISLALALPTVLSVVAVWLLGVRKYHVSWRTLGFARAQATGSLFLPWIALILSLSFGSLYVIVVTAVGIDSLLPTPMPTSVQGEGLYRLVNYAVICILGPLTEETLFRGFLLATLVQPLGALRATVLASAIFALSHVNVGVILPFFVSGLLLSWLYLKTRSIWPSFTAHAAQNVIAMLLVA